MKTEATVKNGTIFINNPKLRPIYDLWEWQENGLCIKVGNTAFFVDDGVKGKQKKLKETHAKRVCRTCPVISQCREHAMSVPEPYGVWGGMTEDERRRARRTPRVLHSIK